MATTASHSHPRAFLLGSPTESGMERTSVVSHSSLSMHGSSIINQYVQTRFTLLLAYSLLFWAPQQTRSQDSALGSPKSGIERTSEFGPVRPMHGNTSMQHTAFSKPRASNAVHIILCVLSAPKVAAIAASSLKKKQRWLWARPSPEWSALQSPCTPNV
jgi:hypothetical protein